MGATYVECSSKEMRGVDEVFASAVDMVCSMEEQGYTNQPSHNRTNSKPSVGGVPSRPGKKVKKRTCKIL
jgi:hypothetical protein